jgi:ammonium transporter, Amt family
MNGVMCACVSVTASSDQISFFSALAIGASSSILYMILSKLAPRISLDDPCEASVIHGACGFWGVLCVGIFSKKNGIFVEGSTQQLKVQFIGALALMLNSGLPAIAFFGFVKKLNRLRVGEIFEILGQDVLDIHDMDIKKQTKDHNKLNDIESIIALEYKQRKYFLDKNKPFTTS